MSIDPEDLEDLDSDDPRAASQQIANRLRAAILTGKLQPGEKLPSQPALAKRYKVARETVKNALRTLTAERLVISRKGSGVFVRAQTQRPVGLRPHIEAAFERSHVTIDFAGLSGETLRDALAEVLDKVRAGRLSPDSIAIRILISDVSAPLVLPALAETGVDDPDVRERSARITGRSVEGILDVVHELASLGFVRSATAEARVHRGGPQFKLYVINGEEAFFGFYPVVQHTVTIKREPVAIFDVLGKDSTLFHYARMDGDASHGAEFVESARGWFDSVWTTIAREYKS